MKLEIVNSGTEEFPFYQIMEGNVELCACDNINKAERIVKLCNLQNVSESVLNQIQIQADIFTEREAKAYESAAHREAYENSIKANTVNDIILMIRSNER
jgi:hypothetical protein